VYNINGALKAVNHPELDPTKDPGRDGTSGSGFLPDYFGYVIDYHDQDYNRPLADFKSGAHPASTNSYSGLPRSTRWKTLTNVGISAHQSMYKYDFDDLGQLKEARLGTYTNSTSVYAPVAQPHDEYDILYDPNGNITRLRRTSSGNQLHDLNYNYTPETNKLATVTNSSNAFRTYSYYANGQISSYIEHGNSSTAYYLKYDDAGHVLEICKAANFTLPVVRFEYNDLGHRVAKHSYHATTYQLTQSTFYLRDPSGRLLSVYQKAPGLPAQERERYLYGMDMIGVMQMDISGQPPELEQPCEECPPPPPPLSIGLGCNGQRMYYLKDQVGNVRVILLRGTTQVLHHWLSRITIPLA
jgi:antitoxin component YwqK of YwqJK toxin-antitoxin module